MCPDYGAVTCVDVCQPAHLPQQCWILSGYSSGNVVLWDFINKRIIKNLKYNSVPILNARFINNQLGNTFIAADTSVGQPMKSLRMLQQGLICFLNNREL